MPPRMAGSERARVPSHEELWAVAIEGAQGERTEEKFPPCGLCRKTTHRLMRCPDLAIAQRAVRARVTALAKAEAIETVSVMKGAPVVGAEEPAVSIVETVEFTPEFIVLLTAAEVIEDGIVTEKVVDTVVGAYEGAVGFAEEMTVVNAFKDAIVSIDEGTIMDIIGGAYESAAETDEDTIVDIIKGAYEAAAETAEGIIVPAETAESTIVPAETAESTNVPAETAEGTIVPAETAGSTIKDVIVRAEATEDTAVSTTVDAIVMAEAAAGTIVKAEATEDTAVSTAVDAIVVAETAVDAIVMAETAAGAIVMAETTEGNVVKKEAVEHTDLGTSDVIGPTYDTVVNTVEHTDLDASEADEPAMDTIGGTAEGVPIGAGEPGMDTIPHGECGVGDPARRVRPAGVSATGVTGGLCMPAFTGYVGVKETAPDVGIIGLRADSIPLSCAQALALPTRAGWVTATDTEISSLLSEGVFAFGPPPGVRVPVRMLAFGPMPGERGALLTKFVRIRTGATAAAAAGAAAAAKGDGRRLWDPGTRCPWDPGVPVGGVHPIRASGGLAHWTLACS